MRKSGGAARREAAVRVCIVMGSHWEAQMGGAQYQARCILEELARKPNVEIFYVAHLTPAQLRRDRYTIVPIGSGKPIGRLSFLPDLIPLYTTLKRLRPDVVYQRGLKSYTGVCAAYCKRNNAKFVFHAAHDDDVRRPHFRGWRPHAVIQRLERRIAEYGLCRTDALVVQTDDQRRLLHENYALDATMVVRNFHPLPAPAAPRLQPKPLQIVWVANFKPSKNPEIFVGLAEAFREHKNVEFLMIGRPGEARRYAALHARIGRIPNLKYLGELPVEEVNRVLAGSDLFINTSSSEGFANTFIQAWLRDVPVVSCFVDPDRCLSEGGAGVLAGSEAGLHTVLGQLLADPEGLDEMKRAAHRYGYRHHTAVQAGPLIEMLCSSVAGPPTPVVAEVADRGVHPVSID